MRELRRRDQIGRCRVRTHRAPERRHDANDVGLVVLFAPVGERGSREFHVLGARGHGRDPRIGQVACVRRRRQRVPLGRRDTDELHPTVAAAHHAHEAVAASFASQDDVVVVEPAEPRAVERELRLLDRDVDLLPAPGAEAVVHRAEHRDCRVPPRVVLRQLTAHLDRWPFGELLPTRATGQDRPLTAGVERHEMVCPVARVGPGEPERGDRHDDRRLVGSAQREMLGTVGDDDVARRGERSKLVLAAPPVVHDHAGLAGVHVQESPARFVRGRVRRAAAPSGGTGVLPAARPSRHRRRDRSGSWRRTTPPGRRRSRGPASRSSAPDPPSSGLIATAGTRSAPRRRRARAVRTRRSVRPSRARSTSGCS